jgi:plastocyanin
VSAVYADPMRPAVLAVLAVTVAGCGSGSAPDEPTDTPGESSAPAAAAEPGDGVAVAMEGLRFGPKDVTVKVGQGVTWTNREEIAHNVVAEKGADFASGTLTEGETFTFNAKKAGTVSYICTFHPGMEGRIIVVR